MFQLALAIQDIHRHEDHAESNAGEIEVDEFDAVGEMDAEAVAANKSARGELVSHARSAYGDVAERERAELAVPIGELETYAVGATAEREVEELSEVHVEEGAALSYGSLSDAARQLLRQNVPADLSDRRLGVMPGFRPRDP